MSTWYLPRLWVNTIIVSMGGVKMLLACRYNSYPNINALHKDYNYK